MIHVISFDTTFIKAAKQNTHVYMYAAEVSLQKLISKVDIPVRCPYKTPCDTHVTPMLH